MAPENKGESKKKKMKILITGASGGLACVVADLLVREHHHQYDVVGVDPRGVPEGRDFPGEVHHVDYRHRKMADIFRNGHFDALIHLGRVPVIAQMRHSARYNVNVLGTRSLLELALRFGVKKVIAVSTFHVYGAHQHNHLHITEEDPLRASQIFWELSDAVELDNISMMFLLRHSAVQTMVLRPVNIVGAQINNQISRLLRSEFCPVLMGYDPMLQFIHESDFARAIALCLESDKAGVYNVAGEGVVPYSHAVRLAGSVPVPVPHFLAYPAFGILARLGSRFPKHLIDYFRFPTIISDEAFRKDLEYKPIISTVDALASIKADHIAPAEMEEEKE